jgi:hypothetical protein
MPRPLARTVATVLLSFASAAAVTVLLPAADGPAAMMVVAGNGTAGFADGTGAGAKPLTR